MLWGRHWVAFGVKSNKVLVFYFVLCLTLWLSALQVPAQTYPSGG